MTTDKLIYWTQTAARGGSFITGKETCLDKLMTYAGEAVLEDGPNGMFVAAGTWSFPVNCKLYDAAREYASICMTSSKLHVCLSGVYCPLRFRPAVHNEGDPYNTRIESYPLYPMHCRMVATTPLPGRYIFDLMDIRRSLL